MSNSKELTDSDLFRYVGGGGVLTKLRYFFFTPGYQFSYILRHAAASKNPFSKALWCFLHRMSMWKYGFQIPVKTAIGRGFRISHFGNIVINGESVIGENFNISQGCLIGSSGGKNSGVPVIGNNVCMNANSIIVGGVKIGDNVLIAPGAFVNFDVPDNSVVIGNPGKIIPRESSPTAKYIIYPVKNEDTSCN